MSETTKTADEKKLVHVPPAERPKGEAAPGVNPAANVPLGGQPPDRPHITYEAAKKATAEEHTVCIGIWNDLQKAFTKALEECPSGRSDGANQIRNHVHSWLVQAHDVAGQL